MSRILLYGAIFVVLIVIGVPAYGIPATLTLPAGIRPGLEELTIDQAAKRLSDSEKSDWELVEAARDLVEKRMAYSRRNSFDSFERAFERGYGYCGQTSFALADLLQLLGFKAEVAQAFENRFPDGTISSHAWVQVEIEGNVRDVDSLFYDTINQEITFTPMSKITSIPPIFKFVMDWGAPAVNAHRYYITGRDKDW